MPSRSCAFCSGASETQALDRGFTACRKCCKEKLIPFLRSALGQDELARQLNALGANSGGRPMIPMSLTGGAMTADEQALVDRAHQIRDRVRRTHRQMTPVELGLSLRATAVETRVSTVAALQREQRRQSPALTAKEAAEAMVKRLGMGGPAAVKV